MKLRSQESRPHPTSRPGGPFFSSDPRRGASAFFQPKLRVGKPGDRFEREADQVADQVVAGGTAPPVQTMCAECAEETEGKDLRRQPDGERLEPGGAGSSAGLEQRLSSSREGGRPLPSPLEQSMGDAFGRDFSSVRVHTDGPVVQLNRDLQAEAFTQGSHVFFNEGNFAPDSTAGRRLLAHELTHVVQQGFAGPAPGSSVMRQEESDQPIQRALLPRNPDCGRTTPLNIHERVRVLRGAHFTETFSKPASGKIKITVTAAAAEPDTCHPDNTFGVNVWQCHIISDEAIEGQHIETIGSSLDPGKIEYRIENLPNAEWNTYDKFYVRIYTTCAVDLDVTVEAVT